MAVFKCKMCGGTIEFNQGDTVGICDSCGTKQTLPKLDSDRKTNLYDRANHFRRNNEFDKAMSIYESILNEDPTDAEAYWSLVLCRYGIEYVEDPASHKRIPTVNRAQFTSIFADEDYKAAISHADGYQREVYEAEAHSIDEIQKGILEISAKEKPFDVFICYKETDAGGRRTQDSVLANDLYHQLTNEGFKVFFSRITLEDKLGTAYEPYIFAALNSAKAMVVLGTKPEYFNAVWVKNEWSRYLALIRGGAKKTLIPAYRDMDPYDLPEEFSHLQAQDMSKLGFMQDLIRGIKKIVKTDEQKENQKGAVASSSAIVAPLIRRAFLFLEDQNWQNADEYCEKVLDQDPENAEAYLGKLMAELHVRRQEDLPNCEKPFDDNSNYQKAARFGDEKLSSALKKYNSQIIERNETARLTAIYNDAVDAMIAANSETAYRSVAEVFKTVGNFKDAESLAAQCLDKAEICRKNTIYDFAKSQMVGNDKNSYKAAITSFLTISGWKDVDEKIQECQRTIERIEAQEEADQLERERRAEEKRIAEEKAAQKRKKIFKISAITIGAAAACALFVYLIGWVIVPNTQYSKAVSLMEEKKYEEAAQLFDKAGIKDSPALRQECLWAKAYADAEKMLAEGKIVEASKAFEAISDYSDSFDRSKQVLYDYGTELINNCSFAEAHTILQSLDYKNSKELAKEAMYLQAKQYSSEGKFEDAVKSIELIKDYTSYKDSDAVRLHALYQIAKHAYDSGDFAKAFTQFEELASIGYEDSQDLYNESGYIHATKSLDAKEYDAARDIFKQISEYKDSGELYQEATYLKACESADKNDFATAINLLYSIPPYKDSKTKLNEIQYVYAAQLADAKEYDLALLQYTDLGNYKDSKALSQQVKYNQATSSFEKKEYEKASKIFDDLGSYKDSKKKAQEAKYKFGEALVNQKNYSRAVTVFDEIKKYEDSASRKKEAMWGYIRMHSNASDLKTYQFLKELKKSGDNDAKKKYDSLYAWKVTLEAVNTDPDNYTTKATSVSRHTSYLHFSFRLSGGPPGEKVTLTHTYQFPGESARRSPWSWKDEEKGSYFGVEWSKGFTHSPKTGKLVLEIFVKGTKESLGSFGVTLTG